MDWRPLGSSVLGILQARMLEWVAMPFSRGSSHPRDRTQASFIAGRFFTVWTTREARTSVCMPPNLCVLFKSFQNGVFFCGLSAMALMKRWYVIHMHLVKMPKFMAYSQFAVRAGFLLATSFHKQVCVCDSNGMWFISENTNCWFPVLRSPHLPQITSVPFHLCHPIVRFIANREKESLWSS